MIKLFWNTHNQIAPNPKDKDKESIRNYKWGLYHKENSDKWVYEILKKIKFQNIESDKNIQKEDTLIIIDSTIDKKIEFYSKLRLICSKIFLIHLGDESGFYNPNSIYDNCNFVWRTFCSSKYFENNKVMCIPIGYKSGVSNKLVERKYKWTFIGTPHKSSRHDLLFQLSDIKPSYCYKTQKFNEKIMKVEEMTHALSSSTFVPCPNGFVHPETYRLYEALQCECIPIVENTYKYYDRLFPNNPFIKVSKWSEAKEIIKKWSSKEIKEKQQECKDWWNTYKEQLQELIKLRIINEKQ